MSGARAVFLLTFVISAAMPMRADERFRTPAEVELRRREVARRLVVLATEADALTTARAEITARLAVTLSPARERLHQEWLDLHARQDTLDREAAALRTEQAQLAGLRTRSATGPLQQGDPQGLGTLDVTSQDPSGTSATAFNPAISIIPDINYYSDNRRGRAFRLTRQADGFAAPGGDAAASTDPSRGFNLREVEAAFAGAIDPYFDVWATFVVQGERIAAEEAYVQTRKFVPGLQLRVGRFLSGIGYINRQHPHQWDFFDQALPYEALLGGGLADTGVQATWLPALPIYTLLGFEALQGDNPRLANVANGDFPNAFVERPGPRVLTGFLRVSPNVGYSSALQLGGSFAHSRHHQEALEQDGVLDEGFEGAAWLAGADVVWRYESGRAYGRGNATLQAEFLYRRMDLDQVWTNGAPVGGGAPRMARQDGFYVQGIYGFIERWTAGGRFDVIGLRNRLDGPSGLTEGGATTRATVNVTFNPTEFSRIRAQYSHSRIRSSGEIERVHQLSLQFQMSLGAHGAHRF
jgi:plasmid maintenance system antidote protein VapI